MLQNIKDQTGMVLKKMNVARNREERQRNCELQMQPRLMKQKFRHTTARENRGGLESFEKSSYFESVLASSL